MPWDPPVAEALSAVATTGATTNNDEAPRAKTPQGYPLRDPTSRRAAGRRP